MKAQIDNEVRQKVYRRDHWRCALCDEVNGLQIHHVVHRSLCGKNRPHNMITLCWRCHAMAHGTRFPGVDLTMEDMEGAITEYMADLYAAEYGLLWNPWAEKMDRIAQTENI